MTIGLGTKRNPARAKKSSSHQSVSGWTIEQAAMPRHVSVSFVVQASGDTARRTTRRFVLPRESAAQLAGELREALENWAAVESIGGEMPAAPGVDEATAGAAKQTDADDVDPMLNHFALGAYGLVGN